MWKMTCYMGNHISKFRNLIVRMSGKALPTPYFILEWTKSKSHLDSANEPREAVLTAPHFLFFCFFLSSLPLTLSLFPVLILVNDILLLILLLIFFLLIPTPPSLFSSSQSGVLIIPYQNSVVIFPVNSINDQYKCYCFINLRLLFV